MEHHAPIAIAADHPALAGHFPGLPVVPGVVLLERAAAAIEHRLGCRLTPGQLTQAKFLSPVAPGATLTLTHGGLEGDSVRFVLSDGARTVASGAFRLPVQRAAGESR
jgi:3-hydroxyacyl-[acyl-carrier-protein] dehydratase